MQTSSAPRFAFLDGLRGVAALLVVIYHITYVERPLLMTGSAVTHVPAQAVLHFLSFANIALTGYGPEAVTLFIVLSGFCLMLPAVSSPDLQLKNGIAGFVKRRARRILPPYYASLMLAPLFWLLAPALRADGTANEWGLSFAPNTAANWISHLLLLHNWTRWVVSIEPPLWSVAAEWQIYFLFALLLLPIFRRFGAAIMLGAAVMLSALGGFFLFVLRHFDPQTPYFQEGKPWMVLSFAIGMLTAVLFKRLRHQPTAGFIAQQRTWLRAAGVLLLLFTVQRLLPKATFLPAMLRWTAPTWVAGMLAALLTGILILNCCLAEVHRRPAPFGTRFLSSPWAVGLGAFSYSLYLFHAYMLWLAEAIVWPLNLAPAVFFVSHFILSVTLALGGSYLFHLAFERPFMPGRPRTVQAAAQAALVSTAP